MKWACRARPDVDLLACVWLIRRYIDPAGSIEFVQPVAGLADVGNRLDLLIADPEYTTFETVVARHGLSSDRTLLRMSRVLRAASFDDELDSDLAGLGLAVIAVGALFAEIDDARLIERSAFVFDALAAWCERDTFNAG